MDITLTIYRYDPEKDKKAYYKTYRIEMDEMDRIVDCLNKVKWEQDGTLTFRKSCAHGVCGSDAIRINGENALACQKLVKDLKGGKATIEPLLEYPVIKDLVVDLDPFFKNLEKIKPYFINDSPRPAQERYQSNEDRDKIDDPVKCILCGACTSSCPSYWYNKDYLGPAALIKAHRFILDTRDEAKEERIQIVNDRNGLWRCHTIFNCNEVCPKEINITQAISELKRFVLASKL